jgi:hypothetical protein
MTPRRRPTVELGTLAGAPVFAPYGAFVLLAATSVVLGCGVVPTLRPDLRPALVWGTSIGTVWAVAASLVVNALAQAWTGRRLGLAVRAVAVGLSGARVVLDGEAGGRARDGEAGGRKRRALTSAGAIASAGVAVLLAAAALPSAPPWSAILVAVAGFNVVLAWIAAGQFAAWGTGTAHAASRRGIGSPSQHTS